MSDLILETIQADVFAVLKNTPALALANVLKNDAETTDSKIEKAIQTLVTTDGKRGLAVVVMRAEVTEAEKNLPGPPLTIKIEIQVVEHVLFNQGADGTEVRSSQAALNVLSALHHRHFGNCLLYSEKNPIKPVQVKTGYVSDAVTLFAKFDGLVTDKPLGVVASMSEEIAAVPNTLTTAFAGANNDLKFTQVISGAAPTIRFVLGDYADVVTTGRNVVVNVLRNFGECYETAESIKLLFEQFPDALALMTVSYAPGNNGSGEVCQPVTTDITFGPTALSGGSAAVPAALTLTCASAGSSIRYTTDGSYPTPQKTLYTAPIAGLEAGTVVRCAAYVDDMPPGDVLELTITE